MLVAGNFIDQQRAQQNQGNAHKIHERADPGSIREERAREQSDDGQLGAAGHKGGQHGGGPALPLIANGTAGHDTGDGTAGAHHEGNHRLARQTHLLEDGVQNHRGASHIAAVLQQGDQEVHDHHQRQEADDRDDTAQDAVHQQCLQNGSRVFKESADPFLEGFH